MGIAYNSNNPQVKKALYLLNQNHSILDRITNGIIRGNGQVASNAEIEKGVKWAIAKANTGMISYSQSNRNLNNPDGWSYDCSSFIITAFNYAGFGVEASTTRDMVRGFAERGWDWIEVPSGNIPSSILQRGDILVKQFEPYGHTQMYIGENKDVNCGGTPANIVTHSVDNWGRGGWDGYLRYKG